MAREGIWTARIERKLHERRGWEIERDLVCPDCEEEVLGTVSLDEKRAGEIAESEWRAIQGHLLCEQCAPRHPRTLTPEERIEGIELSLRQLSDSIDELRRRLALMSLNPDHLYGIFGNGFLGNVTIGSNSTLAVSSYYRNLTVNSGVTLNPGGYKIFCQGRLTNNGTIARNGTVGGGGGTPTAGSGGAAVGANDVGGSGAGGAGGVGDTGGGVGGNTGGAVTTIGPSPASIGGAGGTGGSGDGGGGASGGSAGAVTQRPIRHVATALDYGDGTYLRGGSGGGGGAGGGGDLTLNGGGGGGGGSGGGVVFVAAVWFENNGTISADGGNGGNGGDGDPATLGGTGGGAGGGGGGGGVLFLLYRVLAAAGTLRANGGSAGLGGAAGGTGTNGDAGGAGTTGKVHRYSTLFGQFDGSLA